MPLVLDPSAILALAFDDEVAELAEEVLEKAAADGAVVPAIFWFEVRNVLIVNERRGRLSALETSTFLASLEDLPIEVSPLPPEAPVLALSRQHRLTVYDAAYLELAHRLGAPLATFDGELRAAAVSLSLPLFP